jgi:hypothetical protein
VVSAKPGGMKHVQPTKDMAILFATFVETFQPTKGIGILFKPCHLNELIFLADIFIKNKCF